MSRPPDPAGPRAALAHRLGEAALESTGWQAVAKALEMEFGPDLALRFDAETADTDREPPGAELRLLPVTGLGTWSLVLPEHGRAADLLVLPLAEALGLAARLAQGLPLRVAEGEAVLDPLPYPAILLDCEARFLLANAAGEDLLKSRRLFLPARAGARLRAADPRIDEALEEAAARVLGGDDAGADWLGRRPDDRTHLAIRLRPVGPAGAQPGAARLLLTLRAIGTAGEPGGRIDGATAGARPA